MSNETTTRESDSNLKQKGGKPQNLELLRKKHLDTNPEASELNKINELETKETTQQNQTKKYDNVSNVQSMEIPLHNSIIQSFQNKRRNERSCFGHKETIFGLSISPCGKFFASASQDSTVKVWCIENNKLLSTLNGHSTEHECLRVAWAPFSWMSIPLLEENKLNFEDKYLLATAGADGIVVLWESQDECKNWKHVFFLDHVTRVKNDESSKNEGDSSISNDMDKWNDNGIVNDEDVEVPQIYALQFINEWRMSSKATEQMRQIDEFNLSTTVPVLLTSSDDTIHLWSQEDSSVISLHETGTLGQNELRLEKFMDINFTHIDSGYGGVRAKMYGVENLDSNDIHLDKRSSNKKSTTTTFGGDRNPENLVFVFDASYCPSNSLLGVALSDGTLRLVNGRGMCVTLLSLPGCQSHLTSFSWNHDGSKLASCVATGHLILWKINCNHYTQEVKPSCVAIFEGGHDIGRPLYGTKFCGSDDEILLMSWGVDGKLCLWDSSLSGQVNSPISVLACNGDYPIYALDLSIDTTRETNELYHLAFGSKSDDAIRNDFDKKFHIVLGGGRDSGFLGVPAYIYDVALTAKIDLNVDK